MGLSSTIKDIDAYCVGKLWYWYLPLWLFGVYVFVELFQVDMAAQQMPFVLLIPYSFNFLLHELAHIVTAFLPAILTASAGSVSELLLGVALIIMAIWQRSYFALLFCTLWFALSCQSAGQYMADSLPQRIPLVSLGGALSGQEPLHDWHFVFGQLGLLPESAFIGNLLRVIGMVVALAGLAFAVWLILKMSQAPRSVTVSETHMPSAPDLSLYDDKIFTSQHKPQFHDDSPPPGTRDSFS